MARPLTLKEAAAELGLGYETARMMAKDGRLATFRPAGPTGRRMVEPSEVERVKRDTVAEVKARR